METRCPVFGFLIAAQEAIFQSQSIELDPKITNCRISINYFFQLWSSPSFHSLQGLVNVQLLFLMYCSSISDFFQYVSQLCCFGFSTVQQVIGGGFSRPVALLVRRLCSRRCNDRHKASAFPCKRPALSKISCLFTYEIGISYVKSRISYVK